MSDHTISIYLTFFKDINAHIERLGHMVDQLDILVYYYKRLADPLDKLIMISFELRQEYSLLRETCHRVALKRSTRKGRLF